MCISPKLAPIVVVSLIFPILPYFEGGETPTGLLLIHSVVLLSLMLMVLSGSRLWIPSFLVFFLPYLLTLVVSTFLAPYTYAAFLQLWDFCIAGLFAVLVGTLLKEYEQELKNLNFYFFAVTTIALVASIFVPDTIGLLRVSGTFVNPNYFGTFSLLLLLFGIFLYEHESRHVQKYIIGSLLVLLVIFVTIASSRSVYLASVALFGIYLWKKKPTRLMTSIIVSVLIVGGLVLWFRFYRYQDPFRYYRLKIWKHSLKGILEDPYLGIGLNMLSQSSSRFNFPADTELGRYSRIARSADNQYLQVLAETGFLGFFTFVVGWSAIYIMIKKLPGRFFFLQQSYAVISIIALFSLPLNNTSVLFLFLYLIILSTAFETSHPHTILSLNRFGRISFSILFFLMFYFAVFLPFEADWEFKKALGSTDPKSIQEHLQKAVRFNPYQPYYNFTFAKRVIDAKPNLEPSQWSHLLQVINDSIMLNSTEAEFYAYKARIFRNLLDQTGHFFFYTGCVSAYQAALDYDPFNVFLRTEFAYFLSRSGRVSMAVNELQRAIEAEPAYLNARLFLVELKLREKNIKEARAAFLEFEKYYERYRSMKPVVQQPYTKNLLEVNQEYLTRLRKELFP